MSSTTSISADRARLRLMTSDGSTVRVAIPGSDYRLTLLSPAEQSAALRGREGRTILGCVQAKALRLHRAGGGGRFIEPLDGAPRIIQGQVKEVDGSGRRLLVEAAVPMWISLAAGDDPAGFAVGDLVNCYVESGAELRAEPADRA